MPLYSILRKTVNQRKVSKKLLGATLMHKWHTQDSQGACTTSLSLSTEKQMQQNSLNISLVKLTWTSLLKALILTQYHYFCEKAETGSVLKTPKEFSHHQVKFSIVQIKLDLD